MIDFRSQLPRGAAIHQLALGVDDTPVKFSLPQSLCEQMSLATEDIGNGPSRIRVVRVGSQGAVERVNEMAGAMAGRVKRHLKRFSQTATLLTVGASAAAQGEVRQKENKGAANQQTRSVSAAMPQPPTEEELGDLANKMLQRLAAAQGWGQDFILNKLNVTASSMEQHGATNSQPSVTSMFGVSPKKSDGDRAAAAAGSAGRSTDRPGSAKRARGAVREQIGLGLLNGSTAENEAPAAPVASGVEAWVAKRVRRSTLWGMAPPA